MMKKIYDLTELKRTFVSSKTKLFASLTIIIFMIVGCLHAQAQNVSLAASIDNIDKLPGQKDTNVKAAAISDNSFPEDDKSKIFFIYNVKTGLLLNTGGYWGTHVSLKEFGMPLWIHLDSDKDKYIHFAQKFDKVGAGAGEGNYLEYENKSDESNPDQGVYVDRSYLSGSTIVKRGWGMEPVSDKTGVYRLYTYLYSSSKFNTNKKYYLIAFDQQGDVDKNCGAVAEGSSDIKKASSSSETGNDEWKIITYQQIFDLQLKNTANITKSLDLTFRLQCPGFTRENAALANWKTSKYGGEGQIRFGLEHYYKTPDGKDDVNTKYVDDFNKSSKNYISNYKFPDGADQKNLHQRRRLRASLWQVLCRRHQERPWCYLSRHHRGEQWCIRCGVQRIFQYHQGKTLCRGHQEDDTIRWNYPGGEREEHSPHNRTRTDQLYVGRREDCPSHR